MKHITYHVRCECGWKAGPFTSCAAAQKAVKVHNTDVAHKDYVDVPLFEFGKPS